MRFIHSMRLEFSQSWGARMSYHFFRRLEERTGRLSPLILGRRRSGRVRVRQREFVQTPFGDRVLYRA